MNNVCVAVVSDKRRKSLIEPHLLGIPHIQSVTPLFNLPSGFEPKVRGLTHNHLGTYRCFKGHQQALLRSLQESSHDAILIFEDDAVPKNPNWVEIMDEAVSLLETFEVVSLHGRAYNATQYEPVPNHEGYLEPNDPRQWIVAALAYLVRRETAEKIIGMEYDGVPFDLRLYYDYQYCVIADTPFVHDRSEGSLVD